GSGDDRLERRVLSPPDWRRDWRWLRRRSPARDRRDLRVGGVAVRRLLLIRHPATGLSGTFCGHTDPDLSPRGEAQLSALRHTPPGAEPYMNFTVRTHEDGAQWLSDPSCET